MATPLCRGIARSLPTIRFRGLYRQLAILSELRQEYRPKSAGIRIRWQGHLQRNWPPARRIRGYSVRSLPILNLQIILLKLIDPASQTLAVGRSSLQVLQTCMVGDDRGSSPSSSDREASSAAAHQREMGTRVGKGANWQTEPVVGQSSRQEGSSAVRISFEALHLRVDSDAVDTDRTESLSVQNQGDRIR
jgi:hypothetical protein